MTGVFTYVLKTAKVVSVFKKYSKLDGNNYRPTPLLPDIEKMLEKLTHKRLHTFVNGSIVIYRQQYSMSHVFNITDNVRKAFDDRVFVNLHKAFGTVEYQMLLKKLWSYK